MALERKEMCTMPVPDPSFGWRDATAAFAIIAVVAFLVTWVVTDLGHVSRTPYVAILALTTSSAWPPATSLGRAPRWPTS